MINIDYCVNCDSKNIEKFDASIDPFVIKRMQGENKSDVGPCYYIHCLDCDYAGSSYRFSQEEETRYYQGYMEPGSEYTAQRGVEHCAVTYSSEPYKKIRKDAILTYVSKHIDLTTVMSVLDYGGSKGDLFLDEFENARRYVVDIDPRKLENGAEAVSSPDQCGQVDLIVCTHTLEHVSYPKNMMQDLKRYLKPGGWLYMEVPLENKGIFNHGANFSEHINTYTPTALQNLLPLHGFKNVSYYDWHYSAIIHEAHAVIGNLP